MFKSPIAAIPVIAAGGHSDKGGGKNSSSSSAIFTIMETKNSKFAVMLKKKLARERMALQCEYSGTSDRLPYKGENVMKGLGIVYANVDGNWRRSG